MATPLYTQKETVEEWWKLYQIGAKPRDIAKQYRVHYTTIYNQFRKYHKDVAIKHSESHHSWKGKDASSNSIHRWVIKRMPKPEFCPSCNIRKTRDLANISPKPNLETYNRNLGNWEWLCRHCHMVKDGRLKNLKYVK